MTEPRFKEQVARLNKNSSLWQERDVVLVAYVDPKKYPQLTTFFKIASHPFTAILLGKDGTEKWRTHDVFAVAELTRKIDAMPMGRAEEQARQRTSVEN